MSHYKKICEFGKVHSQCRCPGPKRSIIIKCDRPSAHQPFKTAVPTQVDMPHKPVSFSLTSHPPSSEIKDDFLDAASLPARLDSLLERRLWWMKDSERASLLSDLMEEINNT